MCHIRWTAALPRTSPRALPQSSLFGLRIRTTKGPISGDVWCAAAERQGNNLNASEYVCLKKGSGQGQNLALTVLCVSYSLDEETADAARDGRLVRLPPALLARGVEPHLHSGYEALLSETANRAHDLLILESGSSQCQNLALADVGGACLEGLAAPRDLMPFPGGREKRSQGGDVLWIT